MDSQVFRSALDETLQGRYVVERELGVGGMALVYEAWDAKHERRVAIKVLKTEVAMVSGTERFLREIRLTANLQHPHILPLLDSGSVPVHGMEVPYYVMPLVAGQSMRLKLDLEGRLSWAQAMGIVREVGQALTFAHERGIVHRDIKPENILLSGGANGAAIVADFGVARARASEQDVSLTQTGASVGTPLYMSPEQAFGEGDIDHRTDQYSLATVLFEMLAGEAPYYAPTKEAILARRLVEPIPSLKTFVPDIPTGVDRAIQRALSRKPVDRFESVPSFLAALEYGGDHGGAVERPSERKVPWLQAVALVGVLAATVAVAVWRGRSAPADSPAPNTNSPAAKSARSARPDLIALAAIVPAGGSAVDTAATQALSAALSHAIAPRGLAAVEVRATLRRMRRSDSVPPTLEVAREAALRAGLGMVLVPTIVSLHDSRRIGYQVIAAASSQVLRARDVVVAGADPLAPAIDRLLSTLEADIDSARTHAPTESLSRVTTKSLEALRVYSQMTGATYSITTDYGRTVRQALAFDPEFASMHAFAANNAWFEYDQRAAEDHANKAMASLERIGEMDERERINILIRVANSREDWRSAIDAGQAQVDREPTNGAAWSMLGQILFFDRQFERAVQMYDSALVYEEELTRGVSLMNQSSALERIGRYERAIANYRAAVGVDSTLLRHPFAGHEYAVALDRLGRSAEAKALLAIRFNGKPEEKGYALRSAALIEAHEGHYRKAEDQLSESLAASIAAEDTVGIVWSRELLADIRLTRGDRKSALLTLQPLEGLARSRPLPYEILSRSVKVLARLGETARATALAALLESRTRVRSNAARSRIALARGEVMLAKGQPSQARTLFEQAVALDPTDDAVESLAQAELAAGDFERAANRFEQLGTKRGVDFDGFHTVEHGRYFAALAWERAGQHDRSVAAFQAFVAQWPDPDPDLPSMIEARKRAPSTR